MTTTQAPTKPETDRDQDVRTGTAKGADAGLRTEPHEPGTTGAMAWGWILVAVAFVAAVGLLVASVVGTSDLTTTDVSGSDQHLRNQAADISDSQDGFQGSDMHLQNQAADIANRTSAVDGSDQHLRNQATALANGQPVVNGSDQHLHNQAADAANRRDGVQGSDQRLHNQAADAQRQAGFQGSDQHLHNQAADAANDQV